MTGYRVVSRDGSALAAVTGDAKHLMLVRVMSDATISPLLPGAHVTWSGPPVVTALPSGATPPASILPQPGKVPVRERT